ncbi:zinc ABC transporter substrate-binding protein [Maritalea porphyrae]|mgnify:FL=1|jgi:zinc transport system substrate-binding protein|uniref:zinc ABC transporter substrate-binding protein n=1 Tax=Maritalea porphyrae TaxID=880732 RepID=UPI0022AEC3A4|nr:zinc ABC transporter substrate-binding protein [Maritalea porphyrae]MCZ4273939.1 zinc ABC transporter substrate-binding protein [Maritalea porphyrae]
MRFLPAIACANILALSATSAFADKLQVVTSIRPIESLVHYISGDKAEVTNLVPANASPHNYALKPSDARHLQNADVIFWIDEHFETFLEKAISTLPQAATAITLAEQDGIRILDSRDLDLKGEHHEDEHGHEEEGHDQHEGHDHGEHDLHIWLDPENAKTITNIIAKTLSEKDPKHETLYRANAENLIKELDALISTTNEKLTNVRSHRFVTFHDAYQYYENRFDLQNAGVVTLAPEIKPGAKRLKELQSALASNQISCIFSEPQFDAKLVDLAIQGTNVKAAELDPLGANLKSGTTLYVDLINQLTTNMVGCLDQAQ